MTPVSTCFWMFCDSAAINTDKKIIVSGLPEFIIPQTEKKKIFFQGRFPFIIQHFLHLSVTISNWFLGLVSERMGFTRMENPLRAGLIEIQINILSTWQHIAVLSGNNSFMLVDCYWLHLDLWCCYESGPLTFRRSGYRNILGSFLQKFVD